MSDSRSSSERSSFDENSSESSGSERAEARQHFVIIENNDSDIKICPQEERPVDPDVQYSIGDLHGSSQKLIYFLIQVGLLEMDEINYKKMVDLYEKWGYQLLSVVVYKQQQNQAKFNILDMKKEELLSDLNQFKEILASAKVKGGPQHPLIRLIGDEMADRGHNDYFTLLILEKLQQNHVPYEIITSNHGAEFMAAYERDTDFDEHFYIDPSQVA